MAIVSLNGSEVHPERSKFRTWIELEDFRNQMTKAVDVEEFTDLVLRYLSTALEFSASDLEDLPWKEVAGAFTETMNANSDIRVLPFMKFPVKTDDPLPYEYPGRTFYYYANLIAKSYGWSLDTISTLDVDEALALIQEISIDEARNKEWQWELSDRSIGWDEQLKKTKHNPYPLPDWMLPIPTEPKKYRIPISLLPVGNVIRYPRPDDKPA